MKFKTIILFSKKKHLKYSDAGLWTQFVEAAFLMF